MTNVLVSLQEKIWKSISIWGSYSKEDTVIFLTHNNRLLDFLRHPLMQQMASNPYLEWMSE